MGVSNAAPNYPPTQFGLPTGAQMLVGQSASNYANTTGYATLVGVVGKYTYLTGFDVRGTGATAANTVLVSVTGLDPAQMPYGYLNWEFTYPAGVTVEATPLSVRFPHPLRGYTTNYPIYITVPASGAGGLNLTPVIYGFAV